MKARYKIVIVEKSENGTVHRRIIRHGLFEEKAAAIRDLWAERYADREDITVVMELEY